MASDKLNTKQCQLLQRWYDQELSAGQSVEAEQLVETSRSARIFVDALAELSAAVDAAVETAWQRARPDQPSAETIARLAQDAAGLSEASLAELAPLLERFHDQEADPAEAACVQAVLAQRDDCRAYVSQLDEIGRGVRAGGQHMVDDVDFDGFWDGIADQLDGADQPDGADRAWRDGFRRADHLTLLHRYVDDEVDPAERDRVERWLAADHPEVRGYIGALTEIELGVNAAVETACEQVDLRDIWSHVQAGIDADGSAEVISLAGRADTPVADDTADGRGWLAEYRQAIVGAVAAAVVLAGLVGLFKDQLIGSQERVVVEKRVVYVEQVEYSPGSSVMIDSPVEQASMNADEGAQNESTVIWLFDDDANADDQGPADTAPSAPVDAGRDAGQGAADADADAGPRPAPIGQPI